MCGKVLPVVFRFPKKGFQVAVTHLCALRRLVDRPIHQQLFLLPVTVADDSGVIFKRHILV